jgi:hypothetical protein
MVLKYGFPAIDMAEQMQKTDKPPAKRRDGFVSHNMLASIIWQQC